MVVLLCGAVSMTAAATPQVVQDPLTTGAHGPALVRVPGGWFLLGAHREDPEREPDEFPRARVEFSEDFLIGATEVTVAQFGQFVMASNYVTDAETTGCAIWNDGRLRHSYEATWRDIPGRDRDVRHPVVCVSWRDAQAYVGWLSEQTGNRYRLPTEAEWEYAARGGVGTRRFWGHQPQLACDYANVADFAHGRKYPNENRVLHECDDGFATLAPVASRGPNAFGLFDMLGNVWEWTCSEYVHPFDASAWHCASPGSPAPRVFRGGAWYLPPASVRTTHRNAGAPTAQAESIGFRVFRMF